MKLTRRQFIKQVGIALGSLMATRCARVLSTPVVTCYIAAEVTSTPTGNGRDISTPEVTCYEIGPETPISPTTDQIVQQTRALNDIVQSGGIDPETTRQAQAALGRERLRACWFELDQLAETTRQDGQQGESMQEALAAEHQAALDELVALGEVEEAVAGQIQVAFVAATEHLWAANAPITCYKPSSIDYRPPSSDQLAQQATLLEEMVEQGNLDADTAAQARAAVERDITFLNLPETEVQALYERLLKAGSNIPSFDQVELQVSPEAARAARFLVELLVEG